jgi:hypothetical protein
VSQLLVDYKAGAPTTELMATYGKGTVLGLLRRNGVVMRHQPLTADQVHEAIQHYAQGWSCVRDAQQLGRDQSLIWLALKRAGVPMRDSQGRAR